MDWKQEFEALEQKGQWKDAVVFVRRVIEEHPEDAEPYVRALYLLLNLLLEEDYASHDLEHDSLAEMLKQYFDSSYGKFNNNAEYLFFIGYFMGLAEWYFGQETLDLGHEMLQKATKLEPDNLLYEWAYEFVLGGQLAGSLCERIISNSEQITWLESKGSPGKYIVNVLKSCHEPKN